MGLGRGRWGLSRGEVEDKQQVRPDVGGSSIASACRLWRTARRNSRGRRGRLWRVQADGGERVKAVQLKAREAAKEGGMGRVSGPDAV